MATYLQTDLLNNPFKIKLIKKVALSKVLSGSDKSKLKMIINSSNFIDTLKEKFNKNAYTTEDIEDVFTFIKESN
jgi:hypothetical protein